MKSFKSYLSEGRKIDPTQFEGDLVKAFNSISVRGAEGREVEPDQKFQHAEAGKLAQKCVKSLTARIGEGRKAWRMAGAGGTSVLTPAYKDGGPGKSVKSGEPKCDVVFITTSGGRYRCSVKAGAGAQIASAQTGEMWAVMNAVFTGHVMGPIAQIITTVISETGNSEVYYKNRKQFDKMYGEDCFDALLSKVTGLKSGAGAPTKAELARINEFLNVLGITQKITPQISAYMRKTENRVKLLREFATGELRFNKENYIASHFLKWFENGTVELYDVNTFLQKTLPNFRFALRDRGSGRGIALRADNTGTGKASDTKPCRNLVDEDRYLNLFGNPLDEDRYLNLFGNPLNEERFLNLFENPLNEERYLEIRDQLNEKLSDWVGEVLRRGLKLLASAVSKVVDFFARLAAAGVDMILDYFGVEPTQMEYTW